MIFAQPIWLLIGVLVCSALVWSYRRHDRTQTSLLKSFVSPRLAQSLTRSFSPQRRWFKRAVFLTAIACLFAALARPQAGFQWEETHRQGLDILFAVDTSKSMLTQDVKPNRITRAKLAVDDLLAKLDGDAVGLIAFAGNSFLQCPVTLDYDAFRDSVDALDTNTIPRGGTDIASAIRESQAAFKTHSESNKILILITDGEDLGGEGISAAKDAAKDGIKIFTVGVGSASGELIPVPNENGGTDFVKDASGQFVKSHLDDATLKQIAEATNGIYEPLGQQGEGLTTIYDQGLKPFARHELASRQHKVPLEQFEWPLICALLLLTIEPLIGTRRSLQSNEVGRFAQPVAGAIVLALLFAAFPNASYASPLSAEKAYQKGNFVEASKEYAESAKNEPPDAKLQFNLGAAAYKAGDFGPAVSDFQNALKTDQLPIQQSAYYNLGNTQFRVGEKTEKSDPQATIQTWQSAVKSYEAALQIKPDDADAKYNRDLVKHKLDELQKQQQQKKDDNKNQQLDSKQNSKDQSKNSKGDQKNQNGSPQHQTSDQKNEPDQNSSAGDKNNGAGAQKTEQKLDQSPGQGSSSSQSNDSKLNQPQQDKTASQVGDKKPSEENPEATAQNEDQRKGDENDSAPEKREPGQMTKDEAKRLLDSLKGEDQKVTASAQKLGTQANDNDQSIKDW